MKGKSLDLKVMRNNDVIWKVCQTKDGSYRAYWNKNNGRQKSIAASDIELLLGYLVSGAQVRFVPISGKHQNPALVAYAQEDVVLNGISIKGVCNKRTMSSAPPDEEIRKRGKDVLDWVIKKQVAQSKSEESLLNSNSLDRPTGQEVLSTQRLEQNAFRKKLLKKWNQKCIVTGIDVEDVLRASHIKAYNECNAVEKYDINNGLLLSANIDALFDRHLISFDQNGYLLVSKRLSSKQREALGLIDSVRVNLSNEQMLYMNIHRTIFLSLEMS